jgi:hypothetical protein
MREIRNKSFYFNGLRDLQLAKQPQNDQHNENDSAQTHSGMAHPVAIASEPAAEAAEQDNDHDDDEYHSKRHGTLPQRAAGAREFTARWEQSISQRPVPAEEPGEAKDRGSYFGCSLSAAELMQ